MCLMSHDRAGLDSPLAGLMVVLASESDESEEFKQVWLDVLEAAGCNVLTRLPVRRKSRSSLPSVILQHVYVSM